ncbi:hypothetical protein PAGA_a0137 [Pseudoalteromonas agarivorans DSM 14585]|uniref:Uncharacterized protein n=1 Tax=Pseudoalteromonas agarivorans DSM 14585 TaxID=1312369 RepID=A0ACA8DSC0_9GAMM|nr:hypothetical protein PAGA_a0137 [Pseudoalteromonas agarivorans DSM 14585]
MRKRLTRIEKQHARTLLVLFNLYKGKTRSAFIKATNCK